MSIFKTAQAGEVKTKQISKEGCRVTLSVEAAPELVTKNFQNAAVQVQSRAQMQGFRAGKVPLDLVKQNFGGHIKERALDLTVKSAINAALEDAKLDAVAVPTLTKADFANFDEGKTFTFEIAVDVAPEFDVCDYKGIEITKKPETATDEDVTENLNRVLEANARLETAAEGAVIDDKCYAVVHYTGKRNGTEDYKLSADSELVDMAAPQTMPGLAEGIKGLKKGDEKDFGVEAIDTLLKDMEDHRGEYCCILAGYRDRMDEMIRYANPGLASRFDHKIHIGDYTAEELVDILVSMAAAKQFYIKKEARQVILAKIDREKWRMQDHYVMDVAHEEDALTVLMIVLAIDAAKCSEKG